MKNFMAKRGHPKVPCGDCERRNPSCRKGCEDWKKYEEEKAEMYKKKDDRYKYPDKYIRERNHL